MLDDDPNFASGMRTCDNGACVDPTAPTFAKSSISQTDIDNGVFMPASGVSFWQQVDCEWSHRSRAAIWPAGYERGAAVA